MLKVTVTGRLNLEVLHEELVSAIRSGFSGQNPIFNHAVNHGLLKIETGIADGAEKAGFNLYDKRFVSYSSRVSSEVADILAKTLKYFTEVTITQTYIEDCEPDKDGLFDPEDKGQNPGDFLHLDPTPELESLKLSEDDLLSLGDSVMEPSELDLSNDGEVSLPDLLDDEEVVLGRVGADEIERKADDSAAAQLLAKPISDLGLSIRARKGVLRSGASTIGDLVKMSSEDLLGVKQLGMTSLNEIKDKLSLHGLKLRGE